MKQLSLALCIILMHTTVLAQSVRVAPGDSREGYNSGNYVTDSLSIELRQGKAADLLFHARKSHLGLPPLKSAQPFALDAAQIELGRRLFFDRRLSRNKTMSCAMCHIPEQGFTSNEVKRPIGFEGRAIKRNAPTLLNVAYMQTLFHDAREDNLAQQVWSPLLAANEMNNPSVGAVLNQIQQDPTYQKLFAQSFSEPPNMLNVGQALAQYQSSLIAANSRFDQWYFGDNQAALSAKEVTGFKLFTGEAGCSNCHKIDTQTALFTDQQLHNTGVGYEFSMRPSSTKITVQLAPGVEAQVDQTTVAQVGEAKANDVGRYEISLQPEDRWKFRTPSLRNIALTAPYMHNGEFLTLKDVVQFYNEGGVPHKLLSPMMRPLELSSDEQAALVAFLNTLTSDDVELLVADAFAAPIGDQTE